MSELSARDVSILEGIARNCITICDRVERYGIDGDVFRDDADLREMLLFPLVQIGELANHLSCDFLADHHEVPWRDIVGMRHIIVHGYGTLDASWAWNTITDDVPALRAIVEAIATEASEGESET